MMAPPPTGAVPARLSTGVAGLDDILGGGLAPSRLYLLEGAPGTGKTTLALQFLMDGRARGERGLYVTLSETREELVAVAASHGWTLDGIDLFELSAAEGVLDPDRAMTILHPWEVELGETIKVITDEAERTGAVRVVFDSLSEMRLLAQDTLRFRRQVLSLKQYFAGRGTTVLLLDDRTTKGGESDLQLHSLSHGVITLDRVTLEFGTARRRLDVTKMRGTPYREGWHDYVIRRGGLDVFPRLVASEHHRPFVGDPVPSGVPQLDAMLAGGPLRGTCMLLTGPAGGGKSTLAVQYVHTAAVRGEPCLLLQFDERTGTLLTRTAKLGLDLRPQVDAGLVVLRQVDPAELSPGEFTQIIRRDVEGRGTRIVVIDSLSGYLAAMPQERQLVLQLHELLSYLNQRGVLTLLIHPQAGLIGTMQTQVNISYVAHAILLLRFFEAGGHVRKALSVTKNRGGAHEDTIRELRIDEGGVRVGAVLDGFQGVLTGTPAYLGEGSPLLAGKPAASAAGQPSPEVVPGA